MKQLITFIFLLSSLLSFGQNCDSNYFEQLELACTKKVITNIEFSTYLQTVRKLESNNCFDYIKKRNGQEFVETGLTYLFGNICMNTNSEKATQEFINYLKRKSGSAEEQMSFSFENIFKQNPKRVFSLIGIDTALLDHIAWGFMGNRLYGENNPYERDPNKAYTVYNNEPIRTLTVKTYKNIFFNVYPSLKKCELFKKQIEYLLTTIKEGLKEREK
jgi:hypothetical protein